MGDRTYTVIIVNAAYAELVDALIEETSTRVDEAELQDRCKKYIDYEANGGNIDWLEGLLEENVIPYDKYWEAGSGYGPGAKHVRLRVDDALGGIRLEIKEYADAEGSLLASDVVRVFESEGPEAALARARQAVEAVRPLEPSTEDVPFTAFHKECLLDLKKAAARQFGREARQNNEPPTPALCNRYLDLISGMAIGKESADITAAWLEGFGEAAAGKPE